MAKMTLQDGTIVLEGDKVRAIGGGGRGWRVCKVLEVLKGGGVDKAVLTAPDPFGTVIRTRYQIRAYKKPAKRKQCECEGIGCDLCRPSVYEFCGPMMPDGSHERTED